MLNAYDVTTTLVRERQLEMTRSAVAGRLLRRVRRARLQAPVDDRTYATIVLPPPKEDRARQQVAA